MLFFIFLDSVSPIPPHLVLAWRREDFNQGSEQNWERLSRNQVGEALELTLVLASRLRGDLNVNIALHL